MRIAMWSGPRNLSTAMMYAFGSRSDCAVWDEPFYAAYLESTGLDHPMRRQIIDTGETDPDQVSQRTMGAIPGDKPHFFLKALANHMTPDVDRGWMDGYQHFFLIRHPARVLASYAAKRENPTLADIGFELQYELFESVKSTTGTTPPVVDSADIRANPEQEMRRICDALGLAFSRKMLSWPKGGRPEDGVWAHHWYSAVWNSTGFAGPEGPLPDVPAGLEDVMAGAMPIFENLQQHKLSG